MLVRTPILTVEQILTLEKIWLLQQDLAPILNEPKIWTGTLRRQALGRAIRYSIGIEGFLASAAQVDDIVLGQDPVGLELDTIAALKGYRDAMSFVLQVATTKDFELDTNFLRTIHFMAVGGDQGANPGRWREGPVYVRDELTGAIVHEGADASELPELMSELGGFLVDRPERISIIDAAMAHLNLVLIHPFRDGNGRVARILQSALLATSEKPSPVFLSIEEYLGRNTGEYYEVLREVGGGGWNPQVDAGPWIDFVLKAHLAQLSGVKRRTDLTNQTWVNVADLVGSFHLNDRCVPGLVHAITGGRLTNPSYRDLLADSGDQISLLTASRELALLVELGLLLPIGERKARNYVAGPKLLAVKVR